jgi:hypothetical protein
MTEHPITPPPELVQQWASEWMRSEAALPVCRVSRDNFMTARAAQWGADAELEAVINLAGQSDLPEEDRYFDGFTVAGIRANRRRTRLKEQALAALNTIEDKMLGPTTEEKLIRKALEALPDD